MLGNALKNKAKFHFVLVDILVCHMFSRPFENESSIVVTVAVSSSSPNKGPVLSNVYNHFQLFISLDA